MPHPYMMNRRAKNTDNGKDDIRMIKGRINWNEDEKRQVAAEAFRLTSRNPSLELYEAVERAQDKVLEKDRRRVFDGSARYKMKVWLTPLWAEMQAELQKKAKRGASELFEPTGVNIDSPQIAQAAPEAAKEMPPTGDTPTEKPPVSEPVQDARPSSTDAAAILQSAEPSPQVARVHWNDAERKQIAIRARANMLRWSDMKKIDAFRKAQESEMPTERQRHIQGWSSIADWAEPLLELLAVEEQIALARDNEERAQREREEREAREESERVAAAIAAEQADRERNEAIEAAVKQRLAAMPVESLIRAFAARIAQETIAAMGAEFQTALLGGIVNAAGQFAHREETRPADADKLVAVPKTRLPRLMVCGLMRQQEDDVKRAFLGTVDFVFVQSAKTGGNGEGSHAVAARGGDVDVIFNMIDYSGHDIDRAAKKIGVPFVPLNGSVSALKRTIREWLDGKIVLKSAA